MSLDTILETIRDSAVAESRRLEDQAEADARKSIDNARAEAEAILSKARADTEKRIAALRRSRVSSAKRRLKLELLNAENREVELVFSSALQRLSALSFEERKLYYIPLLRKANAQFNAFYLHCAREEADFFSSLGPSMKLVPDLDAVGGFVLENEQKTVRIDYTFEHLLLQVKASVQEDLRSILFGNEN